MGISGNNTIERIESEINSIIADMKASIADEDKTLSKTANYEQYKERLAWAEKIKKEIIEYKQKECEKDYEDFLLELKSEMFDFSMPIY